MRTHPFDAKARRLIRKGAKFATAKDHGGFDCAITADGYYVLHINPGTCRNAACLPKIVKALNEWSQSK